MTENPSNNWVLQRTDVLLLSQTGAIKEGWHENFPRPKALHIPAWAAKPRFGSPPYLQGLKARHIKILFEKRFCICVGPSALFIEENADLGLAAQAGMCRAVGAGGIE